MTAALHRDEVQLVFDVLRELREQGTAIIYVTHRMNEIFEICDTATIMRSGETVADVKPSEVSLDEIVFYMTGQRPDVEEIHETETHRPRRRATWCWMWNIWRSIPKFTTSPSRRTRARSWASAVWKGRASRSSSARSWGRRNPRMARSVIMGEEVHFRSPADAVYADIGFISGERNREAMFPDRSVAENVFAGAAAKGTLFTYLTAKAVHDFAQKAVDKYDIVVGSLEHPASSLSGGNQQKLVVARWIAMNPTLLLLDDPTKGVDIHSRREIHKILRQCADDGMTVIISSSESDELLELADRVYLFYEGRVSGVLSGATKTPERLVAAMMGMARTQNGNGAAVEEATSMTAAKQMFQRFRRTPAFVGFTLFICCARYSTSLCRARRQFFSARSLNTLFSKNMALMLTTMAMTPAADLRRPGYLHRHSARAGQRGLDHGLPGVGRPV